MSGRRSRSRRSVEVVPSLAIIAVVGAVAGVGGALAAPGREWYRSLDRPSWQPPAAAFGPVWTVLYVLAASSAIAAWHATPTDERRSVFTIYGANAALNGAWTGVFFRARNPRLATVDSAALLATTVSLIARTRRRSRFASAALVPYAAWTAFATALSGETARRNP